MNLKGFVILENEGRFLLIKEAAKKWGGKWFVPGGTAKPGESPMDAAIREAREEAGFEIKIKGIYYIRYQERLLSREMWIFYSAEITGGKIKTKPDKHSLEVKWFPYQKMKSLPLRQRLLELLENYTAKKTMPAGNLKFYR